MYETSCQSRFDARYWMLGAGALGRPRGMEWGGGFRMGPSPLLIATGESIPLRGLEGVPSLPGAPQDAAGLTRKFDPRKINSCSQRQGVQPLLESTSRNSV